LELVFVALAAILYQPTVEKKHFGRILCGFFHSRTQKGASKRPVVELEIPK
jgi:hypothetical protein